LVQKDRFLPKSPTKPPGESRPCSETKVVQTFLNSGDGQDIIVEAYGYNNAIDIVQFGNGINPNNLWLERSGYDLTVSINKTDDRITIKDWYYGSDRRIEQFHLANGKMLLESQVQNLVDAMAAFTASSSAEGDFIPAQKQQLDMVIAASWQ